MTSYALLLEAVGGCTGALLTGFEGALGAPGVAVVAVPFPLAAPFAGT